MLLLIAVVYLPARLADGAGWLLRPKTVTYVVIASVRSVANHNFGGIVTLRQPTTGTMRPHGTAGLGPLAPARTATRGRICD
jgi:hypothetical protein